MLVTQKTAIEQHAAHTGNGTGWDLEWIKVTAPVRPPSPTGYEYHSGYRDADGAQHWMYCRRLPLSAGKCGRCT